MIVLFMKKFVISLSALLAASCAGGTAIFVSRNASSALAYSDVGPSGLTKTINLNDSPESTIRSYYSSLTSLPESERKGTNLLKNLKPVLSNNQVYFSYDGGSARTNSIWCMYEIIDRDWTKSPAADVSVSSSTSYISGASYNASTKTISGYKYGSSNPYLHALYVDRSYDSGVTAWGPHTPRTAAWCMEREHIWPKGHGFNAELSTTGGARGDPMHLWAADGYTNGVHSDNYYGFVGTVTKNCGDGPVKDSATYTKTEWAHNNKLGVSKSLGKGTVFEPQDCDKGDIARACFYMAARYNNFAGASSGIDSNEPNLVLNDSIDTRSGASKANDPYNLGLLHDLLEWHHSDPVDEFEIHRNNLLFNNYSKNRNPFIDFPEWADFIWGLPEEGLTYSAPTGSANPSTDTVNGYNDPSVPSGSVTISQTSASVTVGETVTLTATASDSSAVSWTSSDETVASVDGGVVTGVSDGIATITASATIGGQNYSASCEVTVHPAPSVSISVPSATLQVGDSVTLTAAASDDSAITWVSSAPGVASVADGVVTGVSEGNATITATATIGGKNYSATCEITVVAAPADPSSVKLTEIALDTSKVKKNFFVGDTFTSEGLIVTARYDNGTSKTVTPSEITKPDMSTPGPKTVTVSFTDNGVTKSSVYNITVSPVKHTITASCEKSFFVGESIKKSDITVKDENGAAVTDFTMSDENGRYTFLYSDAASGGAATDKTFTINFWNASCTLTVKVSRKAPSDEATAENLANLIMFKEADEMTETDWAEAIRIFNAMSKEERIAFIKGNTDSVVMTSARARFVTVLNAKGNTIYQSGDDYQIKGHERDAGKGAIPNIVIIIAIGAGALLILIVVIIILVHSKKARKVAKKAVKKATKSSRKKKK